MIKIYQGVDLQKLQEEVNKFMREQGRDLPVRTDVMRVYDELDVHDEFVCTVFYDGVKQENTPIDEEPDNPAENKYSKSQRNDIGIMWVQKDGSLKGKCEGKDVEYPKEVFAKIFTKMAEGSPNEHYAGKIRGTAVKIMPNVFKNKPIHPDWLIYGA